MQARGVYVGARTKSRVEVDDLKMKERVNYTAITIEIPSENLDPESAYELAMLPGQAVELDMRVTVEDVRKGRTGQQSLAGAMTE